MLLLLCFDTFKFFVATAQRILRNSSRTECFLAVRPHALCELAKDSLQIVSEYRYLQVQGVQKAQDDDSVVIIYLNGIAIR